MQTTISPTRAQYIPELLETHVEELEFLWGQRRTALHASNYTLRGFAGLTERVEAHIQGLLAIPDALPDLLIPRLSSDDRDAVFAAACPLLRLSDSAMTAQVLSAFANAQGSVLAGLRDAFSFAPSGQFVVAVRQTLENGDSPHAVAAAIILANQRLLDPASPRLANLLQDENPEVATLAWLAATEADARNISSVAPRPYQQALSNTHSSIRKAALFSAAWVKQTWVLPAARQLAATHDSVGLECLAALGQPEDLHRLLNYVGSLKNPANGYNLLARFGHPGVMETLGKGMSSKDIALAVAAGEAFSLITGFDINGQRQQIPVGPEADEFEQEFAELVWIPDMSKASAYWQQHGKNLSSGARWRQGVNLDGVCNLQTLAEIDLEARWDACTRAAQVGHPISPPPPIY